MALAMVMAGLLVYGSVQYGIQLAWEQPDLRAMLWKREAVQQRAAVSQAVRVAEENMDALALNLGRLQSRIIRLDALGRRLVEMADLDPQEFNFQRAPGLGGPDERSVVQTNAVPDFLASLRLLERQCEDRNPKLEALENLLMNRKLESEIEPAGRPVLKGWLSSFYGYRSDPITGKRVFHDGIDFAGRRNSDVVAVASGVVTFADNKSGYGKLVEISHGNDHLTRYAHNNAVVVKKGDTVKKGQLIAKMGSSGRSTGPHVHFEVIKDGKQTNPISYIRTTR
ncbi:MAG: hypothetical protein DRQ37_01405 [Gammaproteobacteria bacterium]|nr:MAG: hypothetical protein DRQ37_01405 [Gammaproteobacteria bacterium]